MANSIALHQAYLNRLDEVYKRESLTAILDTEMIDSTKEAKKFTVDKIVLSDPADYNRNTGYKSGDVTITQEEKEPNYDRGRRFQVDAMDDLETGYVAFGKLGAEYERAKSIPEVDAVRFAKYATGADVGNKVDEELTADTTIAAIDTAEAALIDAEVPEDNRVLFLNAKTYGFLKSKAANRFATMQDRDLDRSIESFDKMKVVVVPQGRFNTSISLTANGGFEVDGQPINFMIVHKSAVVQYIKHKAGNVISPEENQSADAYIMKTRCYGLNDVWENKKKGIYVSFHTAA